MEVTHRAPAALNHCPLTTDDREMQFPGPLNSRDTVVKLTRLIFASGVTVEFGTLESALLYLNSARAVNVTGADGVERF